MWLSPDQLERDREVLETGRMDGVIAIYIEQKDIISLVALLNLIASYLCKTDTVEVRLKGDQWLIEW